MSRFTVGLLIIPLLTVACTGAPDAADGAGVTAVAAVYPLAWLAEQVAPDAEVTSLAAAGMDPHDLELTPAQRASLEQADVAAYLGPIDFQPQVEAAVAGRQGEVVDAAQVLGEELLLNIEAPDEDVDEARGLDPHVWFDPLLMAELATASGESFATADPERAETYRANAEALRTQMLELADEIAAKLERCKHDEIIVSHAAYAYLTAPHGLEQHGISGAAGHAETSPADLAELAEEITSAGIPAVLAEPVEGRADAETVAREAGVELIEIYALDIVDEATAEKGFPTLLLEQADAVARAAECAGAAP